MRSAAEARSVIRGEGRERSERGEGRRGRGSARISAMPPLLPDDEQLRDFCEQHHIEKLSLFGSAIRGELTDSSDVDVLVDFDPEHVPGLFAIVDMEQELSRLFGRKVDLRTAEDLSRHFRDEVVREARALYEAG
jgi:uncharacterized protein